MNKPPLIKLISLQPKNNTSHRPPTPPSNQAHVQLTQPQSSLQTDLSPPSPHTNQPYPNYPTYTPLHHPYQQSPSCLLIKSLTEQNNALKQQIGENCRKMQQMRSVQQQLQFRREQERQMNQHIQFYMKLCDKYRSRIWELEAVVHQQKQCILKYEKWELMRAHNMSKSLQGSMYNGGQSQLVVSGQKNSLRQSIQKVNASLENSTNKRVQPIQLLFSQQKHNSKQSLKQSLILTQSQTYNNTIIDPSDKTQKTTPKHPYRSPSPTPTQNMRRSVTIVNQCQKQNHPLTPKTRVSINLSQFVHLNTDVNSDSLGMNAMKKKKVFI